MGKVAIIAAMGREIAGLISSSTWRKTRLRSGRYVYESDQALMICSGIGGVPARGAAAEVMAVLRPSTLVSAGFAGALSARWKVGDVLLPATIIDEDQGTTVNVAFPPASAGHGRTGTLVCTSAVVGIERKRMLADTYHADAVDMEAAPVAAIAGENGIPFFAVKAISDEYNFAVPELRSYVDDKGRFQTGRFFVHAALHPGTWSVVSQLASNSNKASQELVRALKGLLNSGVLTAKFAGVAISSGPPSSEQSAS